MLKIFFLVFHGTINLPCNSSFVLSDRLVGRTKNILFKASSWAFRPNRVKSGSLFLAEVNFRSILHWICRTTLFSPNDKWKKLSHPILSPFQHWISTDLEKKWAKSVQLVRVSFFLSDFLQNPYFSLLIYFSV